MKIILLLLCFSIFSAPAVDGYAAVVWKVLKRNRVLIDPQGETFAKGQIVDVVSKDGELKAQIKIYKIKIKKKRVKVYGKVLSGKPGKKDEVRAVLEAGMSDEEMQNEAQHQSAPQGGRGMVAYGGIASIGFSDLQPIVFGADYLHPVMQGRLLIIGGFDYWLASSSNVDVTMLTLAGGASYEIYRQEKMSLEIGGRFGQATYTLAFVAADISAVAPQQSFSSLVASPFARGYYRISSKMALGGEFRYTYYLDKVFEDLRGIYLLGTFQYNF